MVRSNGLVCGALKKGRGASEKRQAFQGPCLMFGKGKVIAQGKVLRAGIRQRPRGLS